jgi:hypothetical protein
LGGIKWYFYSQKSPNAFLIHSPGGLGVRDPDLSCLKTGNIEKKLKELAQNGSFCLVECAIEPCCSIFWFHFSHNLQPVDSLIWA